jgi:hypothetical protein
VRVARKVVAAVLGLTLLAGGVVVTVEIIVAAYNRRPWVLPHDRWYDSATQHSWDSPEARWFFIALAAGGLFLLALQLLRGRPPVLPLATGGSPADLNRRSLERSLVRSASAVDGVAAARARVSPKRTEVVATTNRRQAGDLQPRVAEVVERRLHSLGLAAVPPVTVKVNRRGEK